MKRSSNSIYQEAGGVPGNHGLGGRLPSSFSRPVWCHDCNLGQRPALEGGRCLWSKTLGEIVVEE